MDSTLVIKVKYGDSLRRFNAHVNERGQLDLNMAGLRSKIFGLFNFSQDAELVLTYLDEDGDMVTLVEDDDLLDVMKQHLKFLRVDVQLKNDKFGRSYSNSIGSSTPMRSPRVSSPIPTISSVVLNSVPEPLREALLKVSADLTSNPVIGELLDCLSKMSQFLSTPAQQNATSSTQAANNPAASAVPTAPSVNANQTTTTSPTVTSNQDAENVTRGVGIPVQPFPFVYLNSDLPPPICGHSNGYNKRETKDGNAGQLKEKGRCNGYDKKETKDDNAGQLKEKSIATCASSGDNKFSKLPGIECPFSVMPIPPYMPPPSTFPNPPPTNSNPPLVFQWGVHCDGCGAHPICGTRYKSKVREDYDLCGICFGEKGNESDYIKIERPLSYRLPRWFKRSHDPHIWGTLYQPPPPLPQKKSARPMLDSRFILDVNVFDGTMMAPCTPFTKIWRMRNSGSIVWPQGSHFEWIGGDKFSKSDFRGLEIPVNGVPVNGELDVAVDFISPELPGRYISYWSMSHPSGTKFGQRVWVLIQVDASMKKDPVCYGLQELNLNLPPDCSGPKHHNVDSGVVESSNSAAISAPVNAMTDVDQPLKGHDLHFPKTVLFDASQVSSSALYPTAATSAAASALVNAMADVERLWKDQDYYFPENISMLNDAVTSTDTPQVFCSVSYPIIDLSEPALAAVEPAPVAVDIQNSFTYAKVKEALERDSLPNANVKEAVEQPANLKEAMEKSLLKELEDMGFKQVDLNKEILRMNAYNLEQSVDALCGVSECDPILEELEEMGFCDKEMNRKLLKKNNGSIKRVVMDLLTGEKY